MRGEKESLGCVMEGIFDLTEEIVVRSDAEFLHDELCRYRSRSRHSAAGGSAGRDISHDCDEALRRGNNKSAQLSANVWVSVCGNGIGGHARNPTSYLAETESAAPL